MKRNRKREQLRFGTVTKSLGVCICIAISGLGYVWQKNAIYRQGDEIKKREAALSSAQKRNMMLAAQMAHLESPGQLEAECQQYNLSLVAPKENQVVRLYEPGPEWDMQMANAPLPAQLPAQAHSPQVKTLVKR
jgi:cell division protein FtsB